MIVTVILLSVAITMLVSIRAAGNWSEVSKMRTEEEILFEDYYRNRGTL